MSEILDAADPDAIAATAQKLREGHLAVIPTDTVYGVAADAFSRAGTAALFQAKRRSRRFPLPVLVRSPKQVPGLVTVVPEAAERLMAAYWPGPLTLVVACDSNLTWDLGENQGTVAVRMPADEAALALIRATGPLAVTSANLSGQVAAADVNQAKHQLGDAVSIYLDGGARRGNTASTIVDLTRREPKVLRAGALHADQVLAVARGELDAADVAAAEAEAEEAAAHIARMTQPATPADSEAVSATTDGPELDAEPESK